jgi:hypothetical protein
VRLAVLLEEGDDDRGDLMCPRAALAGGLGVAAAAAQLAAFWRKPRQETTAGGR